MTHPQRLLSLTLYFMVLSWVSLPGLAEAQGPAQRPQVANNPNPNANNARIPVVQKLPLELEQILEAWEKRTANITHMKGTFRRYEYDSVFALEKRLIGKFEFESPDKARMVFEPDPDIPKPPQNMVAGKKYKVQAGERKVWVCTGKELLDIDVDDKTYNRVEIPVAFQGKNITNGPLPFLFGMKAKEMKERYRLALGSMHDVKAGRIHIVAYPLVAALRREFQRAELLLDVKTFNPMAIKLWDPSGNKETVYMFSNHKVNGFVFPIPDPFKPRLFGYKLLTDHKAPADIGATGTKQEAQGNSGTIFK